MATDDAHQEPAWFLRANCPVFLPQTDALTLSATDFDIYVDETLKPLDQLTPTAEETSADKADSDSFTVLSGQPSTTVDARELLESLHIDSPADKEHTDGPVESESATGHPFVDGLKSYRDEPEPVDMENKMLTENGDTAFRSTKEPLLDLFYELEEVISEVRLNELLAGAWACDPLATLKIVFNARSIHLGKSSRLTFYRCAGWLATRHPRTLIANLRWLSRPVIAKKAKKKETEDPDELVMVEATSDSDKSTSYDVRNGVAHGYWKDLLNLLALSANDKLSVFANPKDVLNIEQGGKGQKVTQEEAKDKRRKVRTDRHEAVLKAIEEKPFHRALHLAVARLFAEQLEIDTRLLRDQDIKVRKDISLCAKWAPSTDRFHDKHTFLTSSIAEILYPEDYFVSSGLLTPSTLDDDRTVYLRHAREMYRKDISALRQHLGVVEREISANTFENIKYERVPSLAMQNYSAIFAKKDTDRFEAYLDKVADGKSQISGATLLPSTLIHSVRSGPGFHPPRRGNKRALGDLISSRVRAMDDKVLDGQWNTLVKRIKDSGTMESCIAVCDVSGSMQGPVFSDGTCPMDSAIGLSLLIAEVTQPPFGGTFITFSEQPSVQTVNLSQTFREKVETLRSADWGMSTNFEAVFKKWILPMAIENNLTQEQMVKRVFVFSDMQFDQAEQVDDPEEWRNGRWQVSFERVRRAFEKAGYEVPELVFWNLAGGRAGYQSRNTTGDPIAPKPVTAEQEGVALVSGYSQGMLKVFLDNGSFEEEDKEDVQTVEEPGEDGEVVVEKMAKKAKMDPMSTVKRAISHKAYAMLRVVD